MERTLILIKPDGVQRGLMGEIIGTFERTGLKCVGLKFMQVSRELAEEHYAEHKGKGFYEGLVSFITSSPIVAMVWEGPDAVAVGRKLMGATHPAQAQPGTIRGTYGIDVARNIVHGSDSPSRAEVEVGLFFTKQELVSWKRNVDGWIVEEIAVPS